MAVYKVFLEKDAFISSQLETANTGRDEILEIGSYSSNSIGRTLRTLVKVKTDDIANVVDTYTDINNVTASLKLYLADATEVPSEYVIKGVPVAEAWTEGLGRYANSPINTSGVSWKNKDESTQWSTLPITGVTNYEDPSGMYGGGIWYSDTNLHAEQTHTVKSSHDINLDVTSIITAYYNSTIPNHGIMLKLPDTSEFSTDRNFRL